MCIHVFCFNWSSRLNVQGITVSYGTLNYSFIKECLSRMLQIYIWFVCFFKMIQRRVNGSVNFYRGWNDYKNGFGDVDSEFWIGRWCFFFVACFLQIFHSKTWTLVKCSLVGEEWQPFKLLNAQFHFFSFTETSNKITINIASFNLQK